MTKKEALATWSDACSVCVAGEVTLRDGNWEALSRALRHCTDESTIEQTTELNGDIVVTVMPKFKAIDKVGTPRKEAKFLLVVK